MRQQERGREERGIILLRETKRAGTKLREGERERDREREREREKAQERERETSFRD